MKESGATSRESWLTDDPIRLANSWTSCPRRFAVWPGRSISCKGASGNPIFPLFCLNSFFIYAAFYNCSVSDMSIYKLTERYIFKLREFGD